MKAGREGRWTQYPQPSLLFKRHGYNSDVQTRACGSGPQQRNTVQPVHPFAHVSVDACQPDTRAQWQNNHPRSAVNTIV
jgi:hypothetical protein